MSSTPHRSRIEDNEEAQRCTSSAIMRVVEPTSTGQTTPPTDAPIETALARGDTRAALLAIDRIYGHAVYRFIANMMGATDSADDVFQTTLVQIYRDIDRFTPRTSLRAWVFTIARHRCLDALKSRRRQQSHTVPVDDLNDSPDPAADPATRLDDAQLASRLSECVGELSPQTRTAVLLRYQEGMSYEQIATICGEKPATMRARVSRAMPVLRRCLERTGTL